MKFLHEEIGRYARQMTMPEFGREGQEKLKAARILMVGAGGLGSPAAMYLAAAGIGTLGIVDTDGVELSNLHRQIVHGTADIGRHKVDSAAERLRGINPHVELVLMKERFTATNGLGLAAGWDMVLDGSDNFPTRYATNDVCVRLGIPNVYGSVWRFEGQVSVFDPARGGPCYRCLNPMVPEPGTVPGCAEAGVLGVMPGLVGTLQALEVLKLVTGLGEPMIGRLLHVDGLRMKFREFVLRRDPECARCAEGRRGLPVVEEGGRCTVMVDDEVSVEEFAEVRKEGVPHVLLDVREDWELEMTQLSPCLHIPLGEVAVRMEEIPEELPVYVLCHAGVRSRLAVEALRKAGRGQVFNIRGGVVEWLAAWT